MNCNVRVAVHVVGILNYLVIEHGMTPFRFQTAQKNASFFCMAV